MNSHVSTAELTRKEEHLDDGSSPKKSCTDEKQQAVRQPIIPPSVSVLCSTCSQPQREWNFSIEDGVPINNRNSSSKRLDDIEEKEGKEQKMPREMGRVIYRRPPHPLFSP